MDILGRSLCVLLDRQPKVAVPGLGVFYASYKPAELQFAGKNILPPDRIFEFNQRAKIDQDTSLVNYISELENSSHEEASKQISDFVLSAKDSIRETKKFLIPAFGILALDVEGNIHFFPENNQVYYRDSFGLKPLSAETVFSKTRKLIEREVPIIPLHPFDTDKEEEGNSESPKRAFQWGAYATVLVAFIMALSGVYFLSDVSSDLAVKSEEPVSRQEAGLVPTPSSEKTALVKEQELASQPKVAEIVLPSEPIPIEEKIESKSPEMTFYVIAGSFKEKIRLTRFSKKLMQKGYRTSSHSNVEKGLIRLAIGGFDSKDEAISFLHKSQNEFTDQLWVCSEINSKD